MQLRIIMEEGEIGNRDKREASYLRTLSKCRTRLINGRRHFPLGNLSTERRESLFFSVKREREIYIYIFLDARLKGGVTTLANFYRIPGGFFIMVVVRITFFSLSFSSLKRVFLFITGEYFAGLILQMIRCFIYLFLFLFRKLSKMESLWKESGERFVEKPRSTS